MELVVNGRCTYAYTGGRPFDPSLPVLVFVHGGANDHSVWALQSRYFAYHGFGVLALDLPGHGRTMGPPLDSIEALGSWILATLDAAGVATAALVGHSMGSLVALEATAQAPLRIRQLALVGSTFPMHVSKELLDAARDDEGRAHRMINAWSHAAYAQYPGNPGPGFWTRGMNLRLMQRQPRGTLYVDFNACNNYAGGPRSAEQVSCPVLFLLSPRDLMTSARAAREFAQRFAEVRLEEVPGSGHALMAEAPDDILDALRTFLGAGRPSQDATSAPASPAGDRKRPSGGSP